MIIVAGGALAWEVGDPMVSYWAGPGYINHPEKLTERAARQLKEGGFNTVWAGSREELDVAAKYGLRAIFWMKGVWPEFRMNDEARCKAVAEKIAAVKDHPALYLYFLTDEPSAERFEPIAQSKRWFHRQDPKHPVWVNLLPTYANNRQLGVEGEIIRAYWEHVRLFMDICRPEFLTYDHYQFNVGGDTENYLLNLGIIRQNAAAAGVQFFNGVQACTWDPTHLASPAAPRIPVADELRYLVYTTLAYGAQGIYYYVYSFPGHEGAIAELDGKPGKNYEVVKRLNREFVAVARELRSFRFSGAFVQGQHAPGTTPYGPSALLRLSPETPMSELVPGQRFVDSTLVTRFDGPRGEVRLMVVNLDYRKARTLDVTAPKAFERFNPSTGAWTPHDKCGKVDLACGEGALLRISL